MLYGRARVHELQTCSLDARVHHDYGTSIPPLNLSYMQPLDPMEGEPTLDCSHIVKGVAGAQTCQVVNIYRARSCRNTDDISLNRRDLIFPSLGVYWCVFGQCGSSLRLRKEFSAGPRDSLLPVKQKRLCSSV